MHKNEFNSKVKFIVPSKNFVIIIIIFMDYASSLLFRPLEEYVGPSILTVGTLCFVLFLGCILKLFRNSCLPIVERDIPTVICILEFYYLE
jgi:hypothetical protein